MRHRLYQCKADEVIAARNKVLKNDRSFAERAADPDNKELFEQGLVSVPRNWPKPTEELRAKWLERIDDKLMDISDQVIRERRSSRWRGTWHRTAAAQEVSGSRDWLVQAGRRCSRSPARAKP